MTGKIKSSLCATVLLLWIPVGALSMVTAKALRWRRLELAFPRVFHGFVCKLFGLNCQIEGTPRVDGAALFVSNHVSYMDVFVLGAVLEGAFVAKSEVAGWPVFGKLAALQNTLFLERRAAKAREQVSVVQAHLENRGNLIMFPEGTSTAGDYVAPFRSSLFAAALGTTVQPVTIAYTHYDGKPMSSTERDRYAWYLPDPSEPVPNKPFAEHFLAGLGLKRSEVRVIFHPPLEAHENTDRKQTARYCEAQVREGLEAALASEDEWQTHELSPRT